MNKDKLLKLLTTHITIIENQKAEDLIKQSERKNKQILEITELKQEFMILKKEILERKEKLNKAKEAIKNYDCNHEIRLKYTGEISPITTYKCALCGKSINKVDTPFISLIKQDEYIKNGYTEKIIYEIINFIIDHSNIDEIDLIKEFKYLNLENCEIIYPKNKIKERK